MNKSDLIKKIAARQPHMSAGDVSVSVNLILEYISNALCRGERLEIRDFGVFKLRQLPPRESRNPKSGKALMLPTRYRSHFKPGRLLKQCVNNSANKTTTKIPDGQEINL